MQEGVSMYFSSSIIGFMDEKRSQMKAKLLNNSVYTITLLYYYKCIFILKIF